MAPRQSQTKEDAILKIYSSILATYLSSNKTGLIDANDFRLMSFDRQIEKLKSGLVASQEYAGYYATLGLISAAKGNYSDALKQYNKVMRIVNYDSAYFANYITILLKNSLFKEVENTLVEHFDSGGKDYDLISLLYLPALYSLDFTLFKNHYELIRGKDVLPEQEKIAIEYSYAMVKQFELLKEDLEVIEIQHSVFSEFIKTLNSFHSTKLYDQINFRFKIENTDEQYLLADIYADISIEEAILLSDEFEEKLVERSLEINNTDLLSKFLVYYKPMNLLELDYEPKLGIYLGINEDLMV